MRFGLALHFGIVLRQLILVPTLNALTVYLHLHCTLNECYRHEQTSLQAMYIYLIRLIRLCIASFGGRPVSPLQSSDPIHL